MKRIAVILALSLLLSGCRASVEYFEDCSILVSTPTVEVFIESICGM
jgi:PBP1b-binding outer membrane lipoprotein LpoB